MFNVIQDVGPPTSRKRQRDINGDDPLFVTMTIDQCVVKCISVDTGSFVNVFFKNTFNQIGVSCDQVLPYATPLIGFSGQTTKYKGKITLSISINNTTQVVEFLIVFVSSLYNSIMGRSTPKLIPCLYLHS